MSLFGEDDYENANAGTFAKFENPGDTVEGELVGIDRGKKSKFGLQDVFRVKTENGLVLIGTKPEAVLGKKLADHGLAPGYLLGVRFNGERTTQDGQNKYHDWSVVSKKPSVFDGQAAAPAAASVPASVAADDAPPF